MFEAWRWVRFLGASWAPVAMCFFGMVRLRPMHCLWRYRWLFRSQWLFGREGGSQPFLCSPIRALADDTLPPQRGLEISALLTDFGGV